MLKSLLILVSISFTFLSQAQELNFSTKQKLFENPVNGLLDFPFIPVDFNQDGKSEYVGRALGEVLLYSDQGNGFESTIINSADQFSRPFAGMDFNQDGFEDIVFATYINLYDAETESYTYLNFAESPSPTIVGIADFNGDGFNDLLTIYDAGSLQTNMAIFYWDGEEFENVPFSVELEPGPIRLGDLEGDGDIDIAFINRYEAESPKLLINQGGGEFIEREVLGYSILNNKTMEFEDFDYDGDLDLLVFNSDDEMTIYENRDNYVLPPFQYKIADNIDAMATRVEDLNNDGKLEIISFEYQAPTAFSLRVYQTEQNFEFELAQTMSNFLSPSTFVTFNPNYIRNTLSIRDVESDGDLDIIVSYTLDTDPSVWLFENYAEGLTNTNDIQIENLTLFPNPAKLSLSVKIPEEMQAKPNYTIYNLMGQPSITGKLHQTLDVSNLSAGAYMLKVEDGPRVWLGKFEVID